MLYRLASFFFTGHWNPETLEPRVEAPGHWYLGTLEPRVCAFLSRSIPRRISSFSQIGDFVSTFVCAAARGMLLLRRGAAAKSTPLTPSVVAILFWTDRGHHVPALTVTSGGKDVGFDMHVWGRLTIAHSRPLLNPRVSHVLLLFLFFFLRRCSILRTTWTAASRTSTSRSTGRIPTPVCI